MNKKVYSRPEIKVIQLKHNAMLMQHSNSDPNDNTPGIGKRLGIAPFEEPFNG